jgi:hypothetical protein
MTAAPEGNYADESGFDGDDGEDFVEYDVASELVQALQQMIQLQTQTVQMLGVIAQQLSANKRIVRDEQQRVIGIEAVG